MLAIATVFVETGGIRRASACSVELVCFFAPNQAEVSQRGKQVLADVVKVWGAFRTGGTGFCGTPITPHPVSKLPLLDILGYAWEDGGEQWNLTLSERRARAVADALVTLGVTQNYLTIIALGDKRPRIAAAARGDLQNLRVEIVFQTLS